MRRTELAIKVCTILESGWYETTQLLNALEIPTTTRPVILKLLHALKNRGVLESRGVAKFRWRVANPLWNRDNPFVPLSGTPEPKPAPLDDPIPNEPRPDNSYLVKDLRAQIEELKKVRKVEITIAHPNGEKRVVEDQTHPIFEQVLFHISCGDNVMLVGPKGCGKTYLAEQIAKNLARPHGMMSLSGGVTEGKLFGRVTPNITTGKSEYHRPPFVELFEEGGVFLLDEVDAADPNVLLSINSALANGVLPLDRPKTPLARRHEEFVCMAAANTWGNGADRQYVGRNQQDGAFVERFVEIEMDYDKDLEMRLCPDRTDMVEVLQKIRDNVSRNRMERAISTRFILRAHNWMSRGKEMDYVLKMLFAGWREDEIQKAMN